MDVPGSPSSSGCVTTAHSTHCRTEFREVNPRSWDPNGAQNTLKTTLVVVQPDDSIHGTVIGQVHIDDDVSTKPVCELYYSSSGEIAMGVEQTRSGGNQKFTIIGNVTVGTTFTYLISYSKNVLSISLNGGTAQILSTFSLDAPPSYFKVGNYNQGINLSSVHFFAISVSHES